MVNPPKDAWEDVARQRQEKKDLSDAAFSYDIFYIGPEGFGEHLQVTGATSEAVVAGRKRITEYLGDIQAKPLPRDREGYRAGGFKKNPMVEAAKSMPGVSKVGDGEMACPNDGAALRLINGSNGPFYGCSNYSKGCRYTRNPE